jgi:hypothetical protein
MDDSMYTCHFFNTAITETEAFVGSKNEGKIYFCFKCLIKTLKPFIIRAYAITAWNWSEDRKIPATQL